MKEGEERIHLLVELTNAHSGWARAEVFLQCLCLFKVICLRSWTRCPRGYSQERRQRVFDGR